MMFWEDLSPPVKGAHVVGVSGNIGSVRLWAGVFDKEPEEGVTEQRGFSSQTAVSE